MTVTATELKSNLGKYLDLAASEDIIISKNGKRIARITAQNNAGKLRILEGLAGVIPSDIDEKSEKEDRLLGI